MPKEEKLVNRLVSKLFNLLIDRSVSSRIILHKVRRYLFGVNNTRYFIEKFSARAINVYQYEKLPNEIEKTFLSIRTILRDNKDDIDYLKLLNYLKLLFKSNHNEIEPFDCVCLDCACFESVLALNRTIIYALKPELNHFSKILLNQKDAKNVGNCVSSKFQKRIKMFVKILNKHETLLIGLSERRVDFGKLSCVLRHSCDSAQNAIIILDKYKEILSDLIEKGLTLKNLSNLFNSSHTMIDSVLESFFENVKTFNALKEKANLTYPQLCSLLSGSKNKIKSSMECFMKNIDDFIKIKNSGESTIFFSLYRSGPLIGDNIVKLLKSIFILKELGLSPDEVKHSFSRSGKNNRLQRRLEWVVNHQEELKEKKNSGASPATISKFIFYMFSPKETETDLPSRTRKRSFEIDAVEIDTTENSNVAPHVEPPALLMGSFYFFPRIDDPTSSRLDILQPMELASHKISFG